jgi:methyl-accepting chemotaxis protein
VDDSRRTPLTALLNPLTPVRLGLRALDDLSALARIARREPQPVEELAAAVLDTRDDLRALLGAVRELTGLVGTVVEEVRELRRTALGVRSTAAQLVVGGSVLEATARHLDLDTVELQSGGRDLVEATRTLDAHAAELLAALRPLTRHLPQLLGALDTVESLEDSMETVADTVEPLQGAAERVGKVTKRLSRSS